MKIEVKMCLSKVQSFEDNYSRDSFSDRVCDDLSEVLLQYLPIEDKFRLECVSKQFQRTVFEKQHELVIDRILEFRSVQRETMNSVRYKESSLFTFKSVLQKLPKIRCLRQKRLHQNHLNDRDMDLITKYCCRLTAIHCDLKQISNTRLLAKILSKISSFSADIKCLEIMRNSKLNFQELNLKPPYYECFLSLPLINELQIKNLKQIAIKMSYDIEDHLQEFVANNKSITHLTLDLDINDKNVTEFLFKQITSFDNLIELDIKSQYVASDISFINGLKQIALNCPKLKSLSLSWVFRQEVNETAIVFSQLSKFKHLKRLTATMFGITLDSLKGIEVNINNAIKYLKDLMYLKISFPMKHIIYDTLLSDLDKHLPKLKMLSINGKIEATEETADILSRLSRLESLELKVMDVSIAAIIETKILENCRQIKAINVRRAKHRQILTGQ